MKEYHHMRRIFNTIYESKMWYKGSGSGSMPENTGEYRAFLESYMRTHDITRVLDIGCGDWQSSALIDWNGKTYIGVDVVDAVIEEDRRKYGSDTITFLCADVRKVNLPQADLVIIKDVFQHWSNAEIAKFIDRLKVYPHILIINTVDGEGCNTDIEDGWFRPVDIAKALFCVPMEELLRYKSYRPVKKIYETKTVTRLLV